MTRRPALAPLLSLALLAPLLAAPGLGVAVAGPAPAPVSPVTPAFTEDEWGDDDTGETQKAAKLTGTWKADQDQGSVFLATKTTGVQDAWGKSDPRGLKITGKGVGVALIDTGVTPVAGLDAPGKVVYGPDLSTESQTAATRNLDGYGHGTHMAGIIAGRDRTVRPGDEKTDKAFVGVAPDATLVSVKVGSADGGVDVSQVVAAVDWVVENRATHNIRVINLSYGTDSAQSPQLDPLAHAVENAWRAGIVVVAAAGNDGDVGATRLLMPAVDPYVLSVGSNDHHGSDKPEAQTVGDWTNKGTTVRRPDLIAPGKSVVGLRVPGSYADRTAPEGRVTTEPTGRYFRGTGTSQSAAVVSGAAALLLQRNPELTPDQVKGLLKASADRLMRDASPTQGAGRLDVKGALEILEKGRPAAYAQTFPRSTGTGSLDASRGSTALVDPLDGAVLDGEVDVHGVVWNGRAWATSSSTQDAWSGGSWRGRAWAGDTWGTQVLPGGWSGRAWAGRAWAGSSWSGRAWAGRAWAGGGWSGRAWADGTWASDGWSGRAWAGRAWAGRAWADNGF